MFALSPPRFLWTGLHAAPHAIKRAVKTLDGFVVAGF